jgi:hypothetical protein
MQVMANQVWRSGRDFPKIPRSAFRDREWRLRRHELMFSPRDLHLGLYSSQLFISIRQGSTVQYCQRLRRALLSHAKQSFIHYYVSDVFWSCPRVRVRLCTFRIVEVEVEVLTASAFSDAKLDHQFSLKTLVHQVSLQTVPTVDVQAEDPNIPHSHSLCWQLLLEPLIRPAQRDHHLQR